MLLSGVQATNSKLFRLAKVGLGCLGVVTEVTLQCVPAHELVEHTFVLTSAELRRQHAGLLRNNKHVRYMWIPYTHDVVVVTNNPLQKVSELVTFCIVTLLMVIEPGNLPKYQSLSVHRPSYLTPWPCRELLGEGALAAGSCPGCAAAM